MTRELDDQGVEKLFQEIVSYIFTFMGWPDALIRSTLRRIALEHLALKVILLMRYEFVPEEGLEKTLLAKLIERAKQYFSDLDEDFEKTLGQVAEKYTH